MSKEWEPSNETLTLEEIKDKLNQSFDNQEKLNNELNSMTYDGVCGKLPEWIPDPLRQEFTAHRRNLLKHFSIDDIRIFLERRQELFAEEDPPKDEESPEIGYVPEEIEHQIDALLYIKRLASLGESIGLEAYLGKGGVKVYRRVVNREAGKLKKGHEGDLKRAIRRIINSLEVNNVENVLKALDDGHFIDSFEYFEPLSIFPIDVDQDKEILYYENMKKEKKQVSFSQLKTIVSAINNS